MSDLVIGFIRTYVPIAVGSAVSFLVTLGVEVDGSVQAAAVTALTGVLIALYYGAVRLLAEWRPGFGILLGVNIAPTYSESE